MSNEKIRRMIELARAHYEQGGQGAAGAYYRMVLKETAPPKNGVERLARGEACLWHARKELHIGRIGTAADWYCDAIDADPLAVEYRVEYCRKALVPMGAFKNARIEAERATKIAPEDNDAWSLLGGMEHTLGNVEAAIAAYDHALALDPKNEYARLDRSTVALDTADYDKVREMCEPLLPDNPNALHLMAMVAYREGRHEDAISLYQRAIDGGCYDVKLARWNQSLALHSIGRYLEGWAAHEARGEQKTDGAMALMFKRFTKPLWDGKSPGRLHIHQEMGFGDAIAMARYIHVLAQRGHDICVEVNDSLVNLLARSLPAQVIPKAKDYPGAVGIPNFDYHVPMLSLPAMLKTDINNVPWPVAGGYLRPDAELAAAFADCPAGRPRIGLCWSSGIRKGESIWLAEYGRRKSMDFETLAPVWQLPNAEFFSLQVGPERMQLHYSVHDPLPEKPTWDDTAALISTLDLVVTVDTSVAHLAGALGKPVILMMHTEGSWHWMAERPGAAWNERSPWYPTVHIFRQDRAHDWERVVEKVAGEVCLFEAEKVTAS